MGVAFPPIIDVTRDDGNVNDSGHWCNAWLVRQDRGSHYAVWLALEELLRDRGLVRRGMALVEGKECPGFVFMDGSAIVMTVGGPFRVSPKGVAVYGKVRWMEDR